MPFGEFNAMVDAAVIRLAGLSDTQIADALQPITAAFEGAVRSVAPRMPESDVRACRDLFLQEVGDRLESLSNQSGDSKKGTA